MERKLCNPINISCHQSHNLRFAREFILFFILIFALSVSILVVFLRRRRGTRRGNDILPHKCLREEHCIELRAQASLDNSCCDEPHLTVDL